MNFLSILLLTLLPLLGESQEINLTFVGDAMQHGPQVKAALSCGGGSHYDYSDCFRYISADIADADYSVVNLECPLAGPPFKGYPHFSAPDSYAKALKSVGFDLFLTANNHCMDCRDAGAERTLRTLDALGIPHVGTYLDDADRSAHSPFIATIKGAKIAFLDYTFGTNGIPALSVAVNRIDSTRISSEIDAARAAGAQAVCVCLHWGIEYQLLPVPSQERLADFLVRKGVDLIIGSHPHVVEPMEIRHSDTYNKDVLLVYSLGNFISNQNGSNSRGGSMVKVRLSFIDGKPKVDAASYKLFFVQKPAARGENYVIIPSSRRDLVRADSRSAFDTFISNARDLFNAHNIGVNEDK
jgi:poly-gamma-glutamate capsule biosynthesis protein CapA/YwtB (metallophosphatase superfamily)